MLPEQFSHNAPDGAARKGVKYNAVFYAEPVIYDFAKNRVKNTRSRECAPGLFGKLFQPLTEQAAVAS